MSALGGSLRHWPGSRQRAFLCRWLLVGRLAFGQMGARVTGGEMPRTAWVQMLPETPGDWHPLERVDALNVLTLDHPVESEDGGWVNCCPN